MKQIIILKKQNKEKYFEITYLFWLVVPLVQKTFRVNTTIESVYPYITTEELAALQDGSVVEVTGIASYSADISLDVIKQNLIERYNIAQEELKKSLEFNYFNTYFDGKDWIDSGAAGEIAAVSIGD